MADRQRHLPLLPALKSYLSLKSTALRTAARYAVMLTFASTLALFLAMPKPYWILMTMMFVSLNGYSATRSASSTVRLAPWPGWRLPHWPCACMLLSQ